MRRLARWALLAALAVVGTGCSTLGYYSQSLVGGASVLAHRQSVRELINEPDTPPALRRRLELAERARDFASTELHLPDNASYRTYTDLKRDYVVWSVFAAPEFSLEPKTWCVPLFGCLAYRSYFAKPGAERLAAQLKAKGLDTYVAGIPAYSTVGWFSDPLLSTMTSWPEADLAGMIFHELAHQKLFVPGDSAFDESFAVTVEREGVRRWMNHEHDPEAYAAYLKQKARDRQFVALVLGARARLEKVYASDMTAAQMRTAKQAIFARMRADYRRLRSHWDGYTGYDHWMGGEMNNAKISSVATYERYVPAFQLLLRRQGGDLKAFYAAARAIGKLPPKARHARLEALLKEARR
jgi:predicted aminopeptidase